jgi:GTP-binding protein
MTQDPARYDAEEAGEALARRPWRFLRSAPSLADLPPAGPIEIAFAGRSNVGKSSLINALVNRTGLARASNTPGRTQDLVYFEVPGVSLYLVDMPGYGYAEAPKARVAAWTELVRSYLRTRPTLRRVFLLVDARHGLKPADTEMIALLDAAAVTFQVVLTKTDKVSAAELTQLRDAVASSLRSHPAAHPAIHCTSSERRQGLREIRADIAVLAGLVPHT